MVADTNIIAKMPLLSAGVIKNKVRYVNEPTSIKQVLKYTFSALCLIFPLNIYPVLFRYVVYVVAYVYNINWN